MATWLIFVQLFMVIIAGVATGEKVKTDADGKATWYPTNLYLWYGVRVVRCFAALALWGGAITVIVWLTLGSGAHIKIVWCALMCSAVYLMYFDVRQLCV